MYPNTMGSAKPRAVAMSATKTFGVRLFSGITLTKAEALAIQSRHVAHYAHLRSGLKELVASKTTADALEDGVQYPVQVINQHIPRGGDIEAMCGVDFGGE